MKRILTMLLALLLAASFTACGSKDDPQPDGAANGQDAPPAADAIDGSRAPADEGGSTAAAAPATPSGPAPTPAAESKYVLTYLGCPLPMNADFAPLLAYLGEPANYFEAESCAFDGLDKTYTYDGVEIVTYPDGDVDRVSYVRILSDAVSTPEGITIGSTPEEVAAAYGDDSGTQYNYEDGDCLFSVLFRDGAAISVEYTALTDLLG